MSNTLAAVNVTVERSRKERDEIERREGRKLDMINLNPLTGSGTLLRSGGLFVKR